MLEKIIFLYKSNTNIYVILLFLSQKIRNLFLKKKIKIEKRFFLKLISNLKISSEFFSLNAYNFMTVLSKQPLNFKYLEIGSFEGGSAIYVSTRFKDSEIHCVDNWQKTEDGYADLNFENIEKNFDFNIINHKNILKIKKSSDDFFKTNKINYHVIYIDGYHKSDQVFKDCVNSWSFLRKNGIMICDDYLWSHYKEIKKNPCFAINMFLKTIKNYKILKVSKSQIFIKKI
tara:strand:- start:510 stop:1199 length:690 start_codon:yes stop_codon:yes gene_type:complete